MVGAPSQHEEPTESRGGLTCRRPSLPTWEEEFRGNTVHHQQDVPYLDEQKYLFSSLTQSVLRPDTVETGLRTRLYVGLRSYAGRRSSVSVSYWDRGGDLWVDSFGSRRSL